MSGSRNVRVLAVVVLYRIQVEQSPTWRSLQRAIGSMPPSAQIDVLLYDNSPQPQSPAGPAWYHHDPANGGVAAAYARAAELATEHALSWILLLDQDSELPATFLSDLVAAVQAHPDAGALVPRVFSGDVQISPAVPMRAGFVPLTHSPGPAVGPVTAINSGCAIATAVLRGLLPFPRVFWLDFLDHWIFRCLVGERRVIVITAARMEHSLSVHHRGGMSADRYRNLLIAESAFFRSAPERGTRSMYAARLLGRFLKQSASSRERSLAVQTLATLPAVVRSLLSPTPLNP